MSVPHGLRGELTRASGAPGVLRSLQAGQAVAGRALPPRWNEQRRGTTLALRRAIALSHDLIPQVHMRRSLIAVAGLSASAWAVAGCVIVDPSCSVGGASIFVIQSVGRGRRRWPDGDAARVVLPWRSLRSRVAAVEPRAGGGCDRDQRRRGDGRHYRQASGDGECDRDVRGRGRVAGAGHRGVAAGHRAAFTIASSSPPDGSSRPARASR